MKLNKTIALIGLTFCINYAKAQLTYGNEQFLFNPVMVNPSMSGFHNNQLKLGYDARWLGITDAPQTGYLNYDRMFNGNTGWNVAVISDRLGPINTISIANSFAFHVKTSDETKLSFGIRHHLTQSTLNLDANNLLDPSDPLLTTDKRGVPVNNFDASVAFLNPSVFMVGFSYRNLIPQPRFRYTTSIIEPVLSLQGWFRQSFGDASLEAFTQVTSTSNTPLNFNIGAMAAFQNKYGVGLNFSPKNQVGIFTYLKITEKFNVFYNYNLPISDIAKASKQSHGLGLSIRLGKETMAGEGFLLQPTNESVRSRMF
ncbi:MAG: PorP/SprF family type IX secretion system membrane protein [Bacteroidia bacterium]|nr:PorP/SprF family type IX secretion system membrane protein [Bacteroidia bacterium]